MGPGRPRRASSTSSYVSVVLCSLLEAVPVALAIGAVGCLLLFCLSFLQQPRGKGKAQQRGKGTPARRRRQVGVVDP